MDNGGRFSMVEEVLTMEQEKKKNNDNSQSTESYNRATTTSSDGSLKEDEATQGSSNPLSTFQDDLLAELSIIPRLPEVEDEVDKYTDFGKEKKVHLMICLVGDEKARTTDPDVMDSNYRIPIRYLVEEGKVLKHFPGLGPKDELVVSPEFAAEFRDGILLKVLGKLEKFIGSKKRQPPGTTRRSTILQKQCYTGNVIIFKKRKLREYSSYEGIEASKKLKQEDMKENDVNGPGKMNVRVTSSTGGLKNGKLKEKSKMQTTSTKNNATEDVIVAELEDVRYTVSVRGLKTLFPDTWLNDEIMDYALQLILNRCRPMNDAVYTGGASWVTYFYKKEHNIGYSLKNTYNIITRRGSEPNMLEKKYWVVPVQRENHWIIIVICRPFPPPDLVNFFDRQSRGGKMSNSAHMYKLWCSGSDSPRILIFDSMWEKFDVLVSNKRAFHTDTAGFIRNGLRELHKMFWNESGRDVNVPEFDEALIPHRTMLVPQQPNKVDCGFFCMTYLTYWFNELARNNDDYMSIYKKNYKHWFNPDVRGLRQRLFETIANHCMDSQPENFSLHLLVNNLRRFIYAVRIKEEDEAIIQTEQ